MVLLLFAGRETWFHSVDDAAVIGAIYDYAAAMIQADQPLPPILVPHAFSALDWEVRRVARDTRAQGPADTRLSRGKRDN